MRPKMRLGPCAEVFLDSLRGISKLVKLDEIWQRLARTSCSRTLKTSDDPESDGRELLAGQAKACMPGKLLVGRG